MNTMKAVCLKFTKNPPLFFFALRNVYSQVIHCVLTWGLYTEALVYPRQDGLSHVLSMPHPPALTSILQTCKYAGEVASGSSLYNTYNYRGKQTVCHTALVPALSLLCTSDHMLSRTLYCMHKQLVAE